MAREFPIELPQYVHLRTMLDSVVAGALRYYLDPLEGKKQEENFKFLESHLMAISDRVWHREKPVKPEPGDPCPDGYFNCNGCCVPYECVMGSDPGPDYN
jgi:hypothetical protein